MLSISKGQVAGVVEAVAPGAGGDLRAAVVFVGQTAGDAVLDVDADLAGTAGGDLLALGGEQVHVVQGHRLAHGAHLVGVAGQIGDDDGGFGLTEALHDAQACGLLKLAVDLRVHGLAGDGRVAHGAEVILAQIVLDKHAVHGGRRAEGGDLILCEQGQDVVGVESVEVVDEQGRLAQPLAVDLAPGGLGPAGVGDGQMQTVRGHALPVLRGDEVAQGVLVVVHGDLRIARGAGGEVHEHRVRAAGGVVAAAEPAGEQAVFLVEVMPALPRLTDDDLGQAQAGLGLSQLHLAGHVAVRGA